MNTNIEKKTIQNKNYRKVLFTTPQMQLVVMSIENDIPKEIHKKTTQFIRVESGTGFAEINISNSRLTSKSKSNSNSRLTSRSKSNSNSRLTSKSKSNTKARSKSNKNKKRIKLEDGVAVIIPAGTEHYIKNTGKDPLKLYTLYSPPEHEPQLIQSEI